ncbi:hypothetical protein BVC80_1821g91 [Macleaya cordata]|uniref:Uncharacterized protein n=1 Tax=Macleaya cordata TaxID=56857 RepID=A0A200QZM2_MACCD|nr:hypothetical protein BVC80_1821g91 [Macleaya cordata]
MDIWSWMSDLPNSDDWPESDSPLVFELAKSSSMDINDHKQLNSITTTTTATKSILLKAERASGSNKQTLVTFSLCIQGFYPFIPAQKTFWVSDPCSLSSDKPFLPLLLQLLHEIMTRSPNAHDSTCPRSQLQKLKPEPISWIVDSHSPESFSDFFNFIFLCRLFWICVCDAPSEVGSLYFTNLLAPNLNLLSCKHVLRNFLISIGVDGELCFMRTLGYMLAKWLILSDMRVGLQLLTSPLPSNGFSYATESHGFWILKGYVPVLSMYRNGQKNPLQLHSQLETKETVLKYALAHQQLEAVIQLEYSVYFSDGFIQVNTRVDNLRFHVVKLGFNKNEEGEYAEERHFPSRIRVWVGPEIGANYVSCLSLGRSTENQEREVETKKIVKGSSGKVKAMARTSVRRRTRSWRFEQDAEGHAAIFEAILCDNVSGVEVATWKQNSEGNPKNGLKNRYYGGNRLFNKTGGLVFAGDEYGEGVGWRLSREMEGSVLKWRLGGKIWVSYCPNKNDGVKSNTNSCFETRCVDWCEEVDLPLIPGK